MLNSYLCCFLIGFLIDKINIFPFILGFASGLIVNNNSEIYNMIKYPIETIYINISKHIEKKKTRRKSVK